jgi:hypothetical protein
LFVAFHVVCILFWIDGSDLDFIFVSRSHKLFWIQIGLPFEKGFEKLKTAFYFQNCPGPFLDFSPGIGPTDHFFFFELGGPACPPPDPVGRTQSISLADSDTNMQSG